MKQYGSGHIYTVGCGNMKGLKNNYTNADRCIKATQAITDMTENVHGVYAAQYV